MNVSTKKIEIIIEKSKKEEFFEEIQKLGLVEVISQGSFISEDIFEFPEYANVKFAKSFLEQYKTKENPIKKIIEGKPSFVLSKLKELSLSSEISEVVLKCSEIEEKINILKSRKEQLEKEISTLKKVENLSISLKSSPKNYDYFVGFLKEESRDKFLEEIKKYNHFFEINDKNYFSIIYNKDKSPFFEEIIQKYDIKKESIFWNNIPEEELKEREKELKDILIETEINFKKAEKISNFLPDINALIDYYSWEIEKINSIKKGEETKGYYRILIWTIEDAVLEIKEIVQRVSKSNLVLELEILKEDNPPVYLENKGLMGSFEVVTNVYGLPKKDEFDPTPLLALFFALFFGIALSDTGYGILLVLLSIGMKKILREKSQKRFFNLFIISGIFTIIAGILTGTFFGTEVFAGYRIINPIEDPITTLIIMLFLGSIHLFVGIIIGMFQKISQKDIKSAIGENGGSILFFIGVFISLITKISFFAIIGVILLFLLNILFSVKKGIFSKIIGGFGALYGIVGYFSDVLSYSRLLALGLATGIIAMVINMIAFLFKDMIPIPFVNWIVFLLILVLGHTANLLINTLGSFIHSARLQFVEFFSKFMEGGGRNFKPLNKRGRFIEIIN